MHVLVLVASSSRQKALEISKLAEVKRSLCYLHNRTSASWRGVKRQKRPLLIFVELEYETTSEKLITKALINVFSI